MRHIRPEMSKDETIYLLNKRLRLHYIPNGFKPGLDTVMLAAACPAMSGDKVLDMGCGVGSAGLCLLARVRGVHVTGVDIQPDHVAMACDNAVLNNFHKECDFVAADIRDFAKAQGHIAGFDHVICNPPYLESGAHLRSPHDPKAVAMGHDDGQGADISVADWVRAAFDLIRGNGSLTLIHRADHIDKILQAMGKRFGAVEVIPLWPKAGEKAKRVIVRAMKHRKTPATVHGGVVIHDKYGDYTPKAQQILREAEALS